VEDRLLAYASAADARRERLRAALRQAELDTVTGSPDLRATSRRRRGADEAESSGGSRGDAFARLYDEAERQKLRLEERRHQIESATAPNFRPQLFASSVRAQLKVGQVSA